MKAWVGTSGFAYKAWRGPFYPEDLSEKDFLTYYASRLPSVEINNTFYRMPSRKALSAWADKTSDPFSFVLKASRKITHFKKLNGVEEELDYLLDVMGELGPKLGPTLFQLPPFLKKDIDLLGRFLELLPGGFRAAFEFRSSSWFDAEVYDLLRGSGKALVAADTGKESTFAMERTADYGYARLRREEYSEAELIAWAGRFREMEWKDAYVFFKHEDAGTGPLTAVRFLELLNGGGGS